MSLRRISQSEIIIIKNQCNLSPLSGNLGIPSSGMNNPQAMFVEVLQVFALKRKKAQMVDIMRMKRKTEESEDRVPFHFKNLSLLVKLSSQRNIIHKQSMK